MALAFAMGQGPTLLKAKSQQCSEQQTRQSPSTQEVSSYNHSVAALTSLAACVNSYRHCSVSVDG